MTETGISSSFLVSNVRILSSAFGRLERIIHIHNKLARKYYKRVSNTFDLTVLNIIKVILKISWIRMKFILIDERIMSINEDHHDSQRIDK